MVSFNFKDQFVPMIESGAKVQTIRSKQRCGPGDTMHLFNRLRTKQARLILAPKCIAVLPVVIMPEGIEILTPAHQVFLEGSRSASNKFARGDGFSSFDAMFDWFYETYAKERFYGFVHRWAELPL